MHAIACGRNNQEFYKILKFLGFLDFLGIFCNPTLFDSSAACAEPAAKQNAHRKSFSFIIVHANVEQKISPIPVVSVNVIFGKNVSASVWELSL